MMIFEKTEEVNNLLMDMTVTNQMYEETLKFIKEVPTAKDWPAKEISKLSLRALEVQGLIHTARCLAESIREDMYEIAYDICHSTDD